MNAEQANTEIRLMSLGFPSFRKLNTGVAHGCISHRECMRSEIERHFRELGSLRYVYHGIRTSNHVGSGEPNVEHGEAVRSDGFRAPYTHTDKLGYSV